MYIKLNSLIFAVLLTGCNSGSIPVLDDPQDPADAVRYRVTFAATWSAETHPVNFPEGAAFSEVIGALHNEQVIFWEPGQIASDGVASLAEEGAVAILSEEIDTAIESGYANALLVNEGLASSPGMASFEILVSRHYPLITLVSSLSPSPDWFAGVQSVSLFDGENFKNDFSAELLLYDAGSDSGERYTAPDLNTIPRDIIRTVSSFPNITSFFDGQPAVGKLVFERIDDGSH